MAVKVTSEIEEKTITVIDPTLLDFEISTLVLRFGNVINKNSNTLIKVSTTCYKYLCPTLPEVGAVLALLGLL